MPSLSLRLHKDMLVVAPLLTADLLTHEEDEQPLFEYLNILDDEVISTLYTRFRLAGAQCACTNTLGAQRAALRSHNLEAAFEDINKAGVRLVRQAGFEHILAAVQLAAPDDLLDKTAALEGLLEQTALLISCGIDALLLCADAADERLPAAVAALREQSSTLIIAAHDEADILLAAEHTFEQSLQWLEDNEGSPLPKMVCPRVLVPPAGNPRQYERALAVAGDELAAFALAAKQKGAQFIGTAPGSVPALTGALYATIEGTNVLR